MYPLTIRLLLNMYTNQKLQVKWNNLLSSKFNVTNGVRQGGVLSPLLFSVYVDELLEKLKKSGVGCHIGHIFVGALGYADDLILLCPSVYGLKKMIKICEDYANENDILFNGAKSKYLVFGKYEYNPTIKVNNENVPRCKDAIYLGHKLCTKNTNTELVEDTIKSFNASYHNFMNKFGSCNMTTKNKLFHQYCSSMYGSQLWLLSSPSTENACTQWRKAHRIVLSVPKMTHCDLLPLIADNTPLDCMLDGKFLAFYKSILSSENKVVEFIAKNAIHEQSSIIGSNIRYLRHKYDMVNDDITIWSKSKIKDMCYNKWLSNVNENYPIHANVIREMIMMKEGRCIRTFTNEECDMFISWLSTL